MKRNTRTTRDAIEILDRLHFDGKPRRIRAAADALLNAKIAQEIFAMRTRAGLTQRGLAELLGTAHSVVSRLEDAEYRGHSLKMLQRIAAALNLQLEIHFVPNRDRRRSA